MQKSKRVGQTYGKGRAASRLRQVQDGGEKFCNDIAGV